MGGEIKSGGWGVGHGVSQEYDILTEPSHHSRIKSRVYI